MYAPAWQGRQRQIFAGFGFCWHILPCSNGTKKLNSYKDSSDSYFASHLFPHRYRLICVAREKFKFGKDSLSVILAYEFVILRHQENMDFLDVYSAPCLQETTKAFVGGAMARFATLTMYSYLKNMQAGSRQDNVLPIPGNCHLNDQYEETFGLWSKISSIGIERYIFQPYSWSWIQGPKASKMKSYTLSTLFHF